MLAPKPAYFFDATTLSWRKALVGEPGEWVWNTTTNAWEHGALGAEYVWSDTSNSWEYGGLGGAYRFNSATLAWEKVTEPGHGGAFYWDNTSNSWLANSGAIVTQDRITDAGDIRITDAGEVRETDAA